MTHRPSWTHTFCGMRSVCVCVCVNRATLQCAHQRYAYYRDGWQQNTQHVMVVWVGGCGVDDVHHTRHYDGHHTAPIHLHSDTHVPLMGLSCRWRKVLERRIGVKKFQQRLWQTVRHGTVEPSPFEVLVLRVQRRLDTKAIPYDEPSPMHTLSPSLAMCVYTVAMQVARVPVGRASGTIHTQSACACMM